MHFSITSRSSSYSTVFWLLLYKWKENGRPRLENPKFQCYLKCQRRHKSYSKILRLWGHSEQQKHIDTLKKLFGYISRESKNNLNKYSFEIR